MEHTCRELIRRACVESIGEMWSSSSGTRGKYSSRLRGADRGGAVGVAAELMRLAATAATTAAELVAQRARPAALAAPPAEPPFILAA